MVQYVLLRKHLGTIPSIVFIPDNTALVYNRPRQGHLQHPTIYQLRRPEQPVTASPFGDQYLPLLPPPSNGNRNSQPAPWLTTSRFSENFPGTDGEDQGGKTPAADHRTESSKAVKVVEVDNKPPLSIKNIEDTRVSRDRTTPHLMCKNSKNVPDENFLCRGVIYTQNVNGLSGNTSSWNICWTH